MARIQLARMGERRTGQPRGKRSELSTPPEFAGDPIVWAAWLYYEERMTQEEVAERLGVSRASVGNFLQEARDRNIVPIALPPQHLEWVQIPREFSRRYGLKSCVVIPEGHDDLPVYE